MDLVLDSLLTFGRVSLSASLGYLIGTMTQGRRHVRWAIAWFLAGCVIGAATLWPEPAPIIAAAVLLIPVPLWVFAGLVAGAATLGKREDWYLRTWGWAGFIVGFHLSAVGAMAVVNAVRD